MTKQLDWLGVKSDWVPCLTINNLYVPRHYDGESLGHHAARVCDSRALGHEEWKALPDGDETRPSEEDVMMSKKPPLGLRPRKLWLEERLDEIQAAIVRYSETGNHVPYHWTVEDLVIRSELKGDFNPASVEEKAVLDKIDANRKEAVEESVERAENILYGDPTRPSEEDMVSGGLRTAEDFREAIAKLEGPSLEDRFVSLETAVAKLDAKNLDNRIAGLKAVLGGFVITAETPIPRRCDKCKHFRAFVGEVSESGDPIVYGLCGKLDTKTSGHHYCPSHFEEKKGNLPCNTP